MPYFARLRALHLTDESGRDSSLGRGEVAGMIVLTRERKARGWSISELARRSVMANGDVGKIEAGRLQPYPNQLRKLARALGWPVDDAQQLLEGAESPEPITAK